MVDVGDVFFVQSVSGATTDIRAALS